MSKKTWTILAIIVLGFFGIIWWFTANKTSLDVSKYDKDHVIEATEDNGSIGEHYKGDKDAKVILIEYGDYQCAGCASASSRMSAIAEEYGDKICLIFRNYPITQIHPNSKAAAATAEAAGLQGKFWEMHDLLYKNQSSWINSDSSSRTELFIGFAELLGLDKAKFESDFSSTAVTQKVNFDFNIAKEHQITGTPSFVLNGENLSSDVWGDDGKLKSQINNILKENGIDIPAAAKDSEE